jgi:hypothetical protein
MTDARVDWSLGLQTYDVNGYVGTVVKVAGTNDIELHYDPGDQNDDGVEPWSSEGFAIVHVLGVVGEYYGAQISAGYGNGDWHFSIDEPPENPNNP